jgi:hypothetical protein
MQTYKFYTKKGERLAAFLDNSGEKSTIRIYRCSLEDQFNKKKIRAVDHILTTEGRAIYDRTSYHPEIINFQNKLSGKEFFQYLSSRFFQIKTEYARAVNTVLKRGTERHLINTHIACKLSMQ